MNVATATAIPSPFQSAFLVGRGVLLETIRRKEFYVLLIFALLYVVGILISAIVGIENEQTLVFLLNLGISFAYFSGHLLSLLTAARQIPFEMENRTIYPLLAKPLGRGTYITGKWWACTVAGWITFSALFLMAYIPWHFFPNPPSVHTALLGQAIVLNFISMGVLTAITLLFSLAMPQGVNLALSALLFVGGSAICNFAEARTETSAIGPVIRWVTGYVPDFNMMNLFTRFTDGIRPVAAWEFFALAGYGALLTAISLVLAGVLFQRRPL